jgi:hypothetical protein
MRARQSFEEGPDVTRQELGLVLAWDPSTDESGFNYFVQI